MKKIFDLLAKPSRMGLIVAAFIYVGVYSIISFSGFGGGFASVIGGLIVSILTIAAVVAIPVLLLLKKERATKIVFLLVAGFWLVSRAQNYTLNYAAWTEFEDGLGVTVGIFGFIAGLALTAVLVLLVLHFILKKEVLRFAAVLTFIGGYLFIVTTMVLTLIYYIKMSADNQYYNVPWTSYLGLFLDLTAPVAVLFGYLYFVGAPDYDLPKKAPKEEQPQPAEEAPQEEEPAPAEVKEEEPAPAEVKEEEPAPEVEEPEVVEEPVEEEKE